MEGKKVGRPHAAHITDALRHAAERAMATVGYSDMSIDGLVADAGTTRPTFYRRYPSLAHLVLEVIRDRFGVGEPVDSGSLRDDLLKLQREDIMMFSSPLIEKNLAGLVEAMRIDESVRKLYQEEFVQPRRSNVARIVESAIERGEVVSARVDIDLICDLLVGPIFSRAFLPVDATINDRLAQQTVAVVCSHLGIEPLQGADFAP